MFLQLNFHYFAKYFVFKLTETTDWDCRIYPFAGASLYGINRTTKEHTHFALELKNGIKKAFLSKLLNDRIKLLAFIDRAVLL